MERPLQGLVRDVHDVRLDACRGIALWFVFLDHIPNNIADWLTLRNYGFSDASEVFVFVSGYTCMTAYSARLRHDGWPGAIGHAVRRSCEIYFAFLILFASYLTLIWLIGGGRFLDETNTAVFFQSPGSATLHALALQYTPVNTDILPTFVVLHLVFPAILWSLTANAPATLLASAGLYLAVQLWGLNVPSWPRHEWYFNPFAWQFLFVLGACWAGATAGRLRRIAMSRTALVLALAYLLFGLAVTLRWRLSPTEFLPVALAQLIYPIDKSSLDPLRLLHFLSLAVVAARPLALLDGRTPARWTIPLVRCGRHSLIVFCFSVLLSFAGHVLLQRFHDAAFLQLVVSAAGIALMVAVAAMLDRIGGIAAWQPRSF
jgi:hypothetical protein